MNILTSKPSVTLEQCEAWIRSKKSVNSLAITNMSLLYKAATKRGIEPAVFIAQAMIETGYFKFGGVLDASFHNTCGLKITKGGGDYVANAHMRFASWEDGINAHADHLALYAGAKGFPKYSPNTKGYYNENCKANGTTKDPRHFTYLYGCCKTVEGLSGKWATNKKYAEMILTLVKEIQSNKAVEKKKDETKVKYKNGAYNRKAKVIANTGLNVRKGRPGSKEYNTILEVLKKGTIVEVNYCLDGWFSIYTNKSKPGYISGQYIEFI
jgi:N-acetylmuramoyl-L-alanine amidase